MRALRHDVDDQAPLRRGAPPAQRPRPSSARGRAPAVPAPRPSRPARRRAPRTTGRGRASALFRGSSEWPGASGRLRMPSRVTYFDHESCSAAISSGMNRAEALTLATTAPGTSPSSTSCSMRAKVSVNSYWREADVREVRVRAADQLRRHLDVEPPLVRIRLGLAELVVFHGHILGPWPTLRLRQIARLLVAIASDARRRHDRLPRDPRTSRGSSPSTAAVVTVTLTGLDSIPAEQRRAGRLARPRRSRA